MTMMTIGLAAAPIYGQAKPQTYQTNVPFSNWWFYNPCNDEYVITSGNYHNVYHITPTKDGFLFKGSTNLEGGGTGQITGNIYKVLGNDNFGDHWSYDDPNRIYQFEVTYRVISPGGDLNFLEHYVYKFHVNANGEIIQDGLQNLQSKCLGQGQSQGNT